MNGHVGQVANGFHEAHGNFGYGTRNAEDERILEFAEAMGYVVTSTFSVLGCTLEGNQLRHCAAKPIVQLAIIANTSGFLHQACFDPGTN